MMKHFVHKFDTKVSGALGENDSHSKTGPT